MEHREEIQELQEFLERINDTRYVKVFTLPYFSMDYSNHLDKIKLLNLEELCNEYQEIGIAKKDLNMLCRLCDFLNRNKNGYIPILKDEVFNICYSYTSNNGNYSNNHSVTICSNYINLNKIFDDFLSDKIIYEKTNKFNIFINKILDRTIKKIETKNIKEYVNIESHQIIFTGEEDELDILVEMFENISTDFTCLSETYYLLNLINFILSIVPEEIKTANLCNFIDEVKAISSIEKEVLLCYLEERKIKTLNQLKEYKWENSNLEFLRLIAEVLQNSNFNTPKDIQDALISTLKEKDQIYARLRFDKCLKYNEIGIECGISRAGAQAALSKIEEKLRNSHRYILLKKFVKQVLLFRENDYFISDKLFFKLNIWRGLFLEMCHLKEYKNSGLYIIDGRLNIANSNNDIIDDAINEKELTLTTTEYEFDFIKTLPNIIKKDDLNNYIDIIVENANKRISKDGVKKIIELNYKDYNTLISKNKLNITFFMKQILQSYFPEGLDVYDKINLSRIRNILFTSFNYSVDEYSDRYITSRICKISNLIGRGVWKYNPEIVELPEELIDKINMYIEKYPISAVPFRSVYDEFADDLLEFGIENRYGLQGIIKNILKPQFKATKDYIYTDNSQTYVEIIAEFIKNSKELVTKELLEKRFPGFSITSMQRVINTSSVVNMNGYFASMDNFNITNEEVFNLKLELNRIVQNGEIYNTKNIFYKFKNQFNGLFNRIGINHYLQFYYIINKLFIDDFEFLRPFIAKKGVEIQDKENQLVSLVVEEGEVTIERLRELSCQVGYFMESIMDFVIHNNDEILFHNENKIIAIDKIKIDEEKMVKLDEILDSFMLYSNYRYLSELVDFVKIKELLGPTNKWLLYSIVSAFSTKYDIYRTSVMSHTELIIAKEGFDFNSVKDKITKTQVDYDLEDLLELEDLQ